MTAEDRHHESCTSSSNPGLSRRQFLNSTTAGVAYALSAHSVGASAAPLEPRLARPATTEKNLPTQWTASLFERGQPTVYRGTDLGFIGMPIGGITTGQLYLGGDGNLWYWDIFNQTKPTEQPGAAHYTNPLFASWNSSVDQSFTLKLLNADSETSRPIARGGFAHIEFRGEYPIGYVSYRDPDCPLTIDLEAFSPFIPLNLADSSLPATIMRFTITNGSSAVIAGELTGLIENAVMRSANRECAVRRVNTIVRDHDLLFLNCDAEASSSKGYPDAGTMGLALLSSTESDTGIETVRGRPEKRPAGSLTRQFSLVPGESHVVVFSIVWRFPNLAVDWRMDGDPSLPGSSVKGKAGRQYATRFDSAADVARFVARNFERLRADTRLWHDTWYDSTLPHWFLERTFLNASTLATSTAFRFADGRFYGSEGAGGGPGTCTHVWHYEQGMGRLFPELDVLLRERTDFNPAISFHPDGMINARGEFFGDSPAVDGQAGTILRALRNHQTSPDYSFLSRNWPAIRKATEWLIAQDENTDGILEGAQPNTLDAVWYGPIAWLSGLYLAALRAAEEMAVDAGDHEFAAACRRIVKTGQKNLVEQLFSDGYFVNRPDPAHPEAINSGTGCEIDQVLGQSWAFQLGLGRVLPTEETRSALASLWRYNFMTDVGPHRAVNRTGRWYAMPGEAGLLMCTFPREDWDFKRAQGRASDAVAAGYFNECMTGFEHQVAGHMIWEGLVMEGLAVERAIHDRYHASRRNPWNEVEAGDHYARAMASYGVYLAACGFEYHGPKGYIAFAPRLKPEDFNGAFTAAQGWGAFLQRIQAGVLTATIQLRYGTLRLRTISLGLVPNVVASKVSIAVNGTQVRGAMTRLEDRLRIDLAREAKVAAGERIVVTIS